MVTVPSQNSGEKHEIGKMHFPIDAAVKHDSQNASFYVMTRKAALIQAKEEGSQCDSLEKFHLEKLSQEIVSDEALVYSLQKFNENLKSVLENRGDNELESLDIARKHYKILGFDKASQVGVDAKLSALEDGNDISNVERGNSSLTHILAETQGVLNDFLFRLTALSQKDSNETDENRTYKMLVDGQMLAVENKIAQGLGLVLEDEDSGIMIAEIKQAVKNAEVLGDLDFVEDISLRAVRVAIDMQRYAFANELNASLIDKRLNIKELGIKKDTDCKKIAEMLLNRVKISLLGDLSYVSFGEMMNDLVYIANDGQLEIKDSRNISDVLRVLYEGNDDFSQLPIGDGADQNQEAQRLYKLMESKYLEIQKKQKEVIKKPVSAPTFLSRQIVPSDHSDDDWADNLDVDSLFKS